MNKGTKIALIVAACLIVLGMILLCVSISIGGFSLSYLRSDSIDTTNIVAKTAGISEEFSTVRIEEALCDIQILPSTDGKCRVDYTDSDLFTHKLEVKGETLTITVEDTGSWQDHFMISMGETYVKLYLPMDTLEKLEIATASGNVHIPDRFTFGTASIATASGNLNFSARVNGDLSIGTASGDVALNGTKAASLSVETASGDVELDRVIVAGHMEINTASGDIELYRVDSDTAEFDTASGDIEGTILSPKDFRYDTASGDIELPRSDESAGRWTFDTVSGDIELDIA